MTSYSSPETLLRLLAEPPALAPGIAHKFLGVEGEARVSLLGWRELLDPVFDIAVSKSQLEGRFDASLDHYAVGDLAFAHYYCDANVGERSLGRVSTENRSDILFQIYLEGEPVQMKGYPHQHLAPSMPSILALDLNEPYSVRCFRGRAISFFVPRDLVGAVFPDAAVLHGRRVEATTSLTRLLVAHLAALQRHVVGMPLAEVDNALRAAIPLLGAIFSKQASLSGNARAAVRAAIFSRVRRYVEANLHNPFLSPENVLSSLRLSRASVYRLFEHEGGLAAYIRQRRLRLAADELVRRPHMAVKDIAAGLGFNSASSFTHAFRRAYDMAPQDLHAYASLLR